MRQLDIWPAVPPRPPPKASADPASALASLFAARLSRAVHVTLTDNRSTMVSYRERRGVLRVRLHRAFLRASVDELSALSDYLAGGRIDRGVLERLLSAHAEEEPPPATPCRSAGRFHDLALVFDELNARYFHGAVAARIGWGTASRRRWRRTIQLGSYAHAERLIRIHPALDQAFVPRPYVAWIVFHEMLHEVFGVEQRGRRRAVHPPEFMAIEQSYPDYAACKAWEQANMHRLLRFRGR